MTARRLLDTSLSRAEQLQMPEEAAVSRRNLAELELAQGHVAAAIAQAQTAHGQWAKQPRGVWHSGLIGRARGATLLARNAAHLVARRS